MAAKYILSIDQSTSATKAVLFNNQGQVVARINKEHQQYYPNAGWVEHDPVEIYENTCHVMQTVVKKAGIQENKVICLSITNQRETVVVWDKTTGKPIYNAIVWQCQRGKAYCDELKEKGYTQLIKEKTGLIIDPYFSASGIKWILDNVSGAREKAENGQLLCGTIDSWLIFNLTNAKVHATDHSNACRTMLYNIFDLQWDDEILRIMNIPDNMMPEVMSSNSTFGHVECKNAFPVSIPIIGVMGDSHAALFGQLCLEPGLGKATYGTGSSVMMNIGKQPKPSPEGLVTSIGFSFDDQVDYVFEGNIHCTGDTIKWLVDNLQLIENSSITEKIALSVDDNGGVYFVPAFAGLGAPYWRNDTRALITGMDRGCTKAHIVRAGLESIAYQIKDVVDLMISEAGIPLKELRVDGGPTKNGFLMQFQADMLQSNLQISQIEEASALGVAIMGGIQTKRWKDLKQVSKLRQSGEKVLPKMPVEKQAMLYKQWKDAVNKALITS